MRNLLIICAIAFGFTACEKQSGEGGTSVIEGKVYISNTFQNSTTGEWDTIGEPQLDSDKKVYIIYSDDENDIYDDSFGTHWNGEYRFEYLRKGDYTIYTYSKLDTSGVYPGDYPIFKHITIDENDKTFILDDFILLK